MTALRAPTGGSSDGGDDDASAETVSDHGDSLREIALLIDALRDDDVAARQRSHAALPKIAAALGPRRCRDELVPFVCDLTDDVDGVLLELATRLAELGPLVGGARHAHVLLEPLGQLCAAEGRPAVASLVVALGPAISGPCYQVGDEVVKAVSAAVPNKASLSDAGALLPDEQPGRHRLDIRTAARVQLQGAGIPSERIAHCPLCTVSEPELFHSWRRDQVKAVQWSGIVAQAPV